MRRRDCGELLDRFKTTAVREKCVGSRNCVIDPLLGRASRPFRLFGPCSGLEALVLAPQRGKTLLHSRMLRRQVGQECDRLEAFSA